jgi:RNA polymerase sigma-70 factor (ECF subfamily)
MAELPDSVLIHRFLDGDEGAFRTLYHRHTPRLRMIVARLLGANAADVDDLVQETWFKGCRGIHGFNGDAKFSTWLTSIGIRTVYSRFAKNGNGHEPLFDEIPAEEPAEPGIAVDLERALALLPNHQRMVVVLHDVEGFTHHEIGRQLGIATGTSKATLHRARTALRRLLNGGVTHAR